MSFEYLLDASGTPAFSQIASLLYGTPHDVFHVGGPTIADLAQQMRKVLQGLTSSLRKTRSTTCAAKPR